MKKLLLSLAALGLLVGCQKAAAPSPEPDPMIRLERPAANSLVKSPVEVEGEARGTWFFEGSFLLALKDAEGKVLAESYAEAQSEWMTEDFVPFKGRIIFEAPAATTGELWLIKDNPSGLPEHDDHRVVPVKFK